MKIYKELSIICFFTSVVSLTTCLILHYGYSGAEIDFWVNVCLAIFGSALLTLLNSVLSYANERKKALEGFTYYSRQILSFVNKYQKSIDLDKKLQFFLDYHDLDKIAWDSAYGNLDFFFERFIGNQEYIYDNIYLPIFQFDKDVSEYVWQFRWYLDGSVRKETLIQQYVDELEKHLFITEETIIPEEYDNSGNVIRQSNIIGTRTKLVHNVREHLNGHYFEIMYGKRKARKLAEENRNGQT